MKKLLIQIDSSPHPSVFDRVVAFDGGADEVMSYGGVADGDVRDLVHGAIFTRGPKDLHHTAIFIGGTDMAAGERLLAAVTKAFFGPDARLGDARLERLEHDGRRGRGAHGDRGWRPERQARRGDGRHRSGRHARGGLLAKAGARVTLTSRRDVDAGFLEGLAARFGGSRARPS